MLSHTQVARYQAMASVKMLEAGIVLTPKDQESIEVSDFGLADLDRTGIQLLVYVNTQRVCAKEIVLLPGQTCPEHRHVSHGILPGKEETFRVRRGTVYLYVEGEPTQDPKAVPPNPKTYSATHEIVLGPGAQYTVQPDTKHWFQAGREGAIVSEFSTRSTDEFDVFTDPDIVRRTVIHD